MGNSAHSNFPAVFSRTQRKIQQWRQRHRPRAPIPEELWREAAQLASTYGINRTARALRLDYYSLKKRVATAAGTGERAPEFVEILPGGLSAARPECLIEVEDPGGVKLRIHLQGGAFPDVAALTRAFRECRP
jgi:hypothetical protein